MRCERPVPGRPLPGAGRRRSPWPSEPGEPGDGGVRPVIGCPDLVQAAPAAPADTARCPPGHATLPPRFW
ncbi:hypothetical protein SSCG_01948 [Streptomyces clavuligerus]|nr:hypothetical protein SSCG_01948 [Streptomyces clavuligerus]